ncbi:MAG: hypothetical protein AAFY19_00675 [Pseudomonadota bacterium]
MTRRRVRVTTNRTAARGLIRRDAERAARAWGFTAEDILIEELTPPPQRTGRVYRRGSVLHQASAPGESPARDTGRLVQSVFHDVDIRGMTVRVTVGSPLEKAAFLHFGTEDIEPRPFMAVFDQAEARRQLDTAFTAALGGVG